jgi:hypothetical protein
VYATCFDVIQKSPIGGRVRVTMELLLIIVFVRILAMDKFVRPMLDAKPVNWLYATDTRALMLQTVQNATIFFACVSVCLRALSTWHISFELTESYLYFLDYLFRQVPSGQVFSRRHLVDSQAEHYIVAAAASQRRGRDRLYDCALRVAHPRRVAVGARRHGKV